MVHFWNTAVIIKTIQTMLGKNWEDTLQILLRFCNLSFLPGCCGESCIHLSKVSPRPIQIFQHWSEKHHALCGERNYQSHEVKDNSQFRILPQSFYIHIQKLHIHGKTIHWDLIQTFRFELFCHSNKVIQYVSVSVMNKEHRTIRPHLDISNIPKPV